MKTYSYYAYRFAGQNIFWVMLRNECIGERHLTMAEACEEANRLNRREAEKAARHNPLRMAA